ncbi:unnamed protein product, partial [Ascophyllum nodosum]
RTVPSTITWHRRTTINHLWRTFGSYQWNSHQAFRTTTVLHLSGLYRLQLPGTAVRLLIISGGPSARIRYDK